MFFETMLVAWPVIGALAILIFGGPKRYGPNPRQPAISLASLGLSAATVWILWARASMPETLFGSLRFDEFGLVIALLSACCAAGCILFSIDYLKRNDANHPEFHVLVLFACHGMMIMGLATNLLSLLLGLEIMSVAFYVLAGFFRNDRRSVEASIKYFLTGSFATGIFLFGIALIYGGTTSLDLVDLGAVLGGDGGPSKSLALLGCGFLVAAFAFKVAAAPFHMWLPDVYDGSPTTVTGFMATGVKVAAFGALIRVFCQVYQEEPTAIRETLWWVALATMTIGNVAALAQSSVKRMLAYSSISHAGYMLIGLVVMVGIESQDGVRSFADSGAIRAILYYMLAYAVTNIGAFGVLAHLERRRGEGLTFDELAGLRQRFPLLAFALSVFMLSLAGIPGTAGFVGKFLIFQSAMEATTAMQTDSFVLLAVLGILNSLIGLYYYLRVPIQLYAKPLPEGSEVHAPPAGIVFVPVVLITVAATLWYGFGPDVLGFGVEPALDMVNDALQSLK